MSTTAFHRARSDEQRAERRESILATAASMLQRTRVNDLSLNELARQVGLAKSNVLRYFESREAVLLELYDRQTTGFLDALEARLKPGDTVEQVAATIADLAVERPVFCDLAASAPGVLEHNVSAAVAAAYKSAALESAARFAELVRPALGDVGRRGPTDFAVSALLVIGGGWLVSQPSPGMVAAYDAHPELRAMSIDLRTIVREMLATFMVGLQHRRDCCPKGRVANAVLVAGGRV